jgi:hypothetical protein
LTDGEWHGFCGRFGGEMEWVESDDGVCFFDSVDCDDNCSRYYQWRDREPERWLIHPGWRNIKCHDVYDQRIREFYPVEKEQQSVIHPGRKLPTSCRG